LTSQSQPAVPDAVTRAPEFEALFAPQAEGYLGADCAMSIDLGGGRVAWLFGDTLLGTIRDGRRHPDGMPRNSVAIQRTGEPPRFVGKFHLTGTEGKPDSFWRLPDIHPDEWFWPVTGCLMDGMLVVLGVSVVKGPGPCEALQFRVRRGWIIRVPNPQDEPPQWRIEASPVGDPEGRVFLGMAHHLDGPWLHLFGFRRPADRNWKGLGVILARVPAALMVKGDPLLAAEYWGADGRWSANPDAAAVMFKPAVTEGGIHYDAPRRRFVATTYDSRNRDFLVTTAPAITGPWSEPVVVWQPSEHEPIDDFLSYTFRIHPHLSADPDMLVLTYVVNAKEWEGLVSRPDTYYPRFVRLDLRAV
jgi:hypothetical protein